MPTDEQLRERELIAYVTGYESRNAEVQALREALTAVSEFEWPDYDDSAGPAANALRLSFAVTRLQRLAEAALAGGETGKTE